MLAVVVDLRNPLADDAFELVDVEERSALRILAARVDIRSLVPRQGLEEIFTNSTKEPLNWPFVAAGSEPSWLHRNPEALAHTHHVVREVDLAMVHDQCLRDNSWSSGRIRWPLRGDIYKYRPRYSVSWPHRVFRPVRAGRTWAENLVHHGRYINRFRGNRGQSQPGDAAGVPVHRDGQFDLHPSQRQRIEPEDIEPGCVHQHVLARPSWTELAVHAFWPLSDVAISLGRQSKCGIALFQILENAESICPRRDGDDPFSESRQDPCLRACHHHRAGRFRLGGVLNHDFDSCV
ncbi:hypothetical protein TSOC111612_00200 [Tsukamurella ocularis]|uniref:Uncharacterized protein n=1 Tax=Tsukamurella paurometabola TaxID=2061 RepID=A0A3P8LDY3_TSUPA|nr:Uncharacterised protein [Tsukamurella paurometabola]